MKKLMAVFLVVLCFILLGSQNSGATVYEELKIIVCPGQGIAAENWDKEKFDINLGDNYWKVYQLGQPDNISWQPTENGFKAYILYAGYGLGFLVGEDGKICFIDVWNIYAQTAEGVKINDSFDVPLKIYGGEICPVRDTPDQVNNQYLLICGDSGISFYGFKQGDNIKITSMNIFSAVKK